MIAARWQASKNAYMWRHVTDDVITFYGIICLKIMRFWKIPKHLKLYYVGPILLKFEIECLNKVCRCKLSRISSNDAKVEMSFYWHAHVWRGLPPSCMIHFKNIFTQIICNISKQLPFIIKIKELLFFWRSWVFDLEPSTWKGSNFRNLKGKLRHYDVIIEENYNFSTF